MAVPNRRRPFQWNPRHRDVAFPVVEYKAANARVINFGLDALLENESRAKQVGTPLHREAFPPR